MKRLKNSEWCTLHCGTTWYSFVRAHAYVSNACTCVRAWCVRDTCVVRAWCVRVRFYYRNWAASCFPILSLCVRSQMLLAVQYVYCDTASSIIKCFVLLVLFTFTAFSRPHKETHWFEILFLHYTPLHISQEGKKEKKKKDQLPLNATRQFCIQ